MAHQSPALPIELQHSPRLPTSQLLQQTPFLPQRLLDTPHPASWGTTPSIHPLQFPTQHNTMPSPGSPLHNSTTSIPLTPPEPLPSDHDEDDDEDQDEDQAQSTLMASMGFATFGSQSKSGSRAKKPKLSHGQEQGSGSNTMPLGKPREALLPTPAEAANAYELPHYADEAGDAAPVMGAVAQRLEITSAGASLPAKPPAAVAEGRGKGISGGVRSAGGAEHGRGQGVGQRRTDGKREDGSWDWQALRRGVRDERGDVAFYDGSFVEDPWRGLRGKEGG